MKIILIIFLITFFIFGIILITNFSKGVKKERYQTLEEEMQKYYQLTALLGELCTVNKQLCDQLSIRHPLARGIKSEFYFMKRVNEELSKDIQNLKFNLEGGKVEIKTEDVNKLDGEFRKLFVTIRDYQGYILYICRKYSQLCRDLEIPTLSFPIYKDRDNKYMKDLLNKLSGYISRLRKGVEDLKIKESQDENILYDFE